MPKTKNGNNKEVIENTKNKIFEILELTSEKNYFNLIDLDNDIEKQQQILALEDEIKQNFPVSTWSYFTNKRDNKPMERPYLNLVRGIFKACNVDYHSYQTALTQDNIKKYYMKYVIKF